MAVNFLAALGAGSGIDTKALAQSLVDAERAPRQALIDARVAKSEARVSGYSAMRYALSTLKDAFAGLNDLSDFASTVPRVSQPAAFGITTGPGAQAGSFAVNISAVATAQSSASAGFAARDTMLNGGSAFDLQLSIEGGTQKTITIPAGKTTPAGIVSAINSDETLGVTAQLVKAGGANPWRVVITGETGSTQSFVVSSSVSGLDFGASLASGGYAAAGTALNGGAAFDLSLSVGGGAASTITVTDDTPTGIVDAINAAGKGVTAQLINVGGANPWKVMISGDTLGAQTLSLGSALPGVSFSATTSTTMSVAGDASLTVNGLSVTRSTNTIDDLVDGVTIDLYTATTGDARVDLSRDTSGIRAKLDTLVSAYNDFQDTMKILADRGSKVEEFGGALAGDRLLQSVRAEIRSLLTLPSDTPGTMVRAVYDVGLTIDNDGVLSLDAARLESALQTSFSEVTGIFSANTDDKSVYNLTDPAGIAGGAVRRIDQLLRSSGDVAAQSKAASAEVKRHEEELTRLDDRMTALLERYTRQFSLMESIVGNSNSLRTSLTSTFDGMMSTYTRR